jgi:hypothetical protein
MMWKRPPLIISPSYHTLCIPARTGNHLDLPISEVFR